MTGLKTILDRLAPVDDAGVAGPLVDQTRRVRARLSRVRRKVLVLSGKGGVGKSAVASQLALALARRGEKVGVLDADLNGPCIPRMLGIAGRRLEFGPDGAAPVEGPHGIRTASMSFLADPRGPVRWKGPMDLTPVWLGMMESGVIREFLADVAWGELDTLLFDLPPGAAADKPPAIVGLVPDLHGAVVVTTPSAVAIDVVRRSIIYARDLGIRILGIVENMGSAACPRCGGPVELSEGAALALAEEAGVPLLARVPRDPELARSLDSGVPLAYGHPISRVFLDLAERLSAP